MTLGAHTSLGTVPPTGTGTARSSRPSTGARTLGTTEDGTRHGIMIHGITVTHGRGTLLGTTADGTIHGTGILGSIAAGTEVGTEAGTTRGTTEDGDTVLITSIMISSAPAAAGSTLRVCPRQDQAPEAASDHHPEAPASGVRP